MAVVRKIGHKNGLHFLIIPGTICRSLGWTFGDHVAIYIADDHTVALRKVPLSYRDGELTDPPADEPVIR